MTASPPATAAPGSRTVAGALAARLRDAIVSDELAWGAKLRQVELAQRFGVSTTPGRGCSGRSTRRRSACSTRHAPGSPPRATELDQRFHHDLYACTGRAQPLAMIGGLRETRDQP